MSIPIFYTPVVYDNKMFIDGGCMDNYPISMFSSELDNVIGIHLATHAEETKNIDNLENYLINLVFCLFQSMISYALKGYEKQTINVVSKSSSLDFNLSDDKKKEIYDEGYKAAIKYFELNK